MKTYVLSRKTKRLHQTNNIRSFKYMNSISIVRLACIVSVVKCTCCAVHVHENFCNKNAWKFFVVDCIIAVAIATVNSFMSFNETLYSIAHLQQK